MSRISALLILALAVGSGFACRCVKPQPGEEVCGADGREYASECLAFCIGQTKAACEGPCPCEKEEHPCLDGTLDLCCCCWGKYDAQLKELGLTRPEQCLAIKCRCSDVTKG